MPENAGLTTTQAEWQTYLDALQTLSKQADTEAQNALGFLLEGVQVNADLPADAQGPPVLDASEALLSGIDTFADRCQAAGSTAFQ